MNELPPSPESNPQPNPAPSPEQAVALNRDPLVDKGAKGRTTSKLLYLALIVLAVLLAAQWWYSHKEVKALRTETARRLQAGDTVNTETKVIVKSVQEATRELQSKISVLESKQIEAQSQQLALEQLYQELSRNRDDWALAEIEQVLSTASQQLQLAGNVQGALIALQNADTRLSRTETAQFVQVRRAIAKDMERLKSLPSLDLTGIALRLDSVIGQIDAMPLLADEKPSLPATQPKTQRVAPPKAAPAAAAPAPGGDETATRAWLRMLEGKWQSWGAEMWMEVRQLIQIRSVDTPDALLLSPTQAYFARENLKLRLLNARLALLSRNEPAFRSDMIAAQDTIAKYFDTRAKQTQAVQVMLKQVQSSNLAIEMPTLTESLNAVRNYKAKP